MKENEKKLFKELCKFKNNKLDESLLKCATPAVLGQLFFNRMQGIAYDALKKSGMLGKVNREFRNSLAAAYEQNLSKNQSFIECVSMISDILAECNCKVAMLKGAFLCPYYPEGYRTSNDIDLLVLPQDVTTVCNLLYQAGFRQGNIRNGEFVPAGRKEIIASKMMRGETVPYIKEVNLPYLKYLEVDINFSLDYKNGGDDVLAALMERSCIRKIDGISIPTLEKHDFFIHLCAHLYKEATTLPWIQMHRDMTLYKYCDIYMLLSEMTDSDIVQIFARSKTIGLEKICAYTILETMGLFDIENNFAKFCALENLAGDLDFCLQIVSPKEKKYMIYQTADVNERFFMEDRTLDLKEVVINEKA